MEYLCRRSYQKELKATPWRRKERGLKELRPQRLDEISNELNQRTITPDEELNRVLGGGLVAGSIILIGGTRIWKINAAATACLASKG